MPSNLRVDNIVPSTGTSLGIGTAGGTLSLTGTTSITSVTANNFTATGPVLIGSATSTGTASQTLQVTGGAYISGNTGIGTTNTSGFNGVCDDVVISGSADVGMTLYATASTGSGNIAFTRGSVSGNTHGAINYNHTSDYMIFQTNLGEKMRIDSSGRVTMPYQPAFSVYPAAGTPIGSGTIVFTGVRFNIGSHYSTSTGRFTAPVSGIYLAILTVQKYAGTATDSYIDIQKNGGDLNARFEPHDGAQYTAGGISAVVQMSAGDYLTVWAGANVFHDDSTNFSGFLLG